MAEGDAPASSGGKGLTRKVGPLPVWGWAVLGFGVYYWYTHYGPGASSGAAAGQGAGTVTVGNITQKITETLKPGSTTTTTTTTTGGGAGGGGGKPPPRKCPRGFFWDPDDRGGRGRCVRIKGHRGPDQPGSDRAATAAAVTSSRPGGPVGPPVRVGGTSPPPRRPKTSRTTTTTTGTAGAGGPGQTVIVMPPEPPPTGGPVNAQTGQPVYWEWQHAHRGPQVPPPVQAYAPGTNGSVYGPAADVAVETAAAG